MSCEKEDENLHNVNVEDLYGIWYIYYFNERGIKTLVISYEFKKSLFDSGEVYLSDGCVYEGSNLWKNRFFKPCINVYHPDSLELIYNQPTTTRTIGIKKL